MVIKKWKPKDGERYWTVGYIVVNWNRWSDDVHKDKLNYYFGNYFRTEKEANKVHREIYKPSPDNFAVL